MKLNPLTLWEDKKSSVEIPDHPRQEFMLDIAIIIVSWNVRSHPADCLRSVFADLRISGLNGEVWVIDNNSTDGTPDMVRNLFPQVNLVVNDHNPGFGAANNQGMKLAAAAEPRYYFLLNPDTFIRPKALREMISFLDQNPKAGMCGARLVFGDGRFQHSAFAFPGITQLLFDLFSLPDRLYETRVNGRYPRRLYDADNAPFQIDHPLGATMMVKRNVAEATGGFDEEFFMYCEELDWCWRIRKAGWEIYAVPSAEIVHYGGESTSQVQARSVVDLWNSRAKFYNRHHGRLTNAIARRIVRIGMRRKAAKTSEPTLREAYRQVASIWQSS